MKTKDDNKLLDIKTKQLKKLNKDLEKYQSLLKEHNKVSKECIQILTTSLKGKHKLVSIDNFAKTKKTLKDSNEGIILVKNKIIKLSASINAIKSNIEDIYINMNLKERQKQCLGIVIPLKRAI